MRTLSQPKEVRNALAYVLLNARKHYKERNRKTPPVRLDELSSGIFFDGWKDFVPDPPKRVKEVAEPRSWLLSKGWRRHQLVSLSEVPGCAA